MLLKLISVPLLLLTRQILSKDFGYDGPYGPLYWGDNYNSCQGKHQSPINIEEHTVINVTLSSLKFIGSDRAQNACISNNGHTVVLKMVGHSPMFINGGPVGDHHYIFEQLHFHWGENDLEGSEDRINNHSFAMELHAVFYNEIYGSMISAIDRSDGLAVLAYFIEANDDENLSYKTLIDSLPMIENVTSVTELKNPLTLASLLLPKYLSIHDYFTYNGSLTTPPCSESVIWIDFKDSLRLSHQQIAAFRNIQNSDGIRLTHNFRPVQPLEDRRIFHNIPMMNNSQNKSDQSRLVIYSLIWTVFFLSILLKT